MSCSLRTFEDISSAPGFRQYKIFFSLQVNVLELHCSNGWFESGHKMALCSRMAKAALAVRQPFRG